MGRNSISLGRIFGIAIALDYSWFLIFALLTWSLATGYYPAEFPNWPVAQYWVLGAVTAILLFASVLLHELAHSVVAQRDHMPVTSITLFIFGGVSQIGNEMPSAAAEFRMAIAGPLTSFAVALAATLVQPLLRGVTPLLALAEYLAYINVTLGIFNLIPGFPLDGGRVFRAIVWGVTHNLRKATLIAGTLGRFIAYLFILFGVWQIFSGNLINGLWIAFIGWFLESAASSQVQHQTLQDALTGHKVSDVMNRTFTTVPVQTTLQDLVDHYILGSGRRAFVVTQDDKVVGLVTLHCIKDTPRSQWPTTTAGDCMIPALQMKRVQPDEDLWAGMEEMDRDGVNQLPVMTDGQILGLLSRDDVISFLRARRELGIASA
jgi:Zn-dependent protease